MSEKNSTYKIVTEVYEDDVEDIEFIDEGEPAEQKSRVWSGCKEETGVEAPKDDVDLALQYKPSAKQIYVKRLFHKSVPPGVKKFIPLEKVSFEIYVNGVTVSIFDYLPSVDPAMLEGWCKDSVFWRWLLIEDTADILLEQAKVGASNYILSLMQLSDWDEERGSIDKAVINLKLRVASMILKTEQQGKVIVNKNQTQNNFIAGGRSSGGALSSAPKSLVKKSESELEYQLKELEERSKA